MSTEVKEIEVPAAITGRFNIALTESKFQKLADEAMRMEYNEDTVEEVADLLKRIRAVGKKIEETHKAGKEESLRVGKQWDKAKNTFLSQLAAVEEVPAKRYSQICREMQDKKLKEQQEAHRVSTIKDAIEANAIWFAKTIADCKTTKQLTDIESKINLETTRKDKYQEFLPNAVERFKELNAIVKSQKGIVKQLEKIAKDEADALLKGDDEKVMELREKQEAIEAQQEENKTIVQQTAINQTQQEDIVYTPSFSGGSMPKARRTVWKFELVDQKEAMKKVPEMLVVSLDTEKVKASLQTMKDAKVLDGKKELTLNGIRYYEEQTF